MSREASGCTEDGSGEGWTLPVWLLSLAKRHHIWSDHHHQALTPQAPATGPCPATQEGKVEKGQPGAQGYLEPGGDTHGS